MKRTVGFTLIETVMAMAMISVALLALMHAVISSMQLVEVNRQDALAMNAAREKIAEIEARSFADVFATYRNHVFPVAGLGTTAGRVLFPVNGSGNLDETLSASSFLNMGFPRDMNGDNDANDSNVNDTYTTLPMKIRINWQTVQGMREVEFTTILTNYK